MSTKPKKIFRRIQLENSVYTLLLLESQKQTNESGKTVYPSDVVTELVVKTMRGK